MDNFGIIHFIDKDLENGKRKCGYCKQTSDEATYGMWAFELTCESYQNLIDRNWRRSGQYCYKPINDKICCPMYTIRCSALQYSLGKSHRKVIKNFNNFIKFDIRSSRSSKIECSPNEFVGSFSLKQPQFLDPGAMKSSSKSDNVQDQISTSEAISNSATPMETLKPQNSSVPNSVTVVSKSANKKKFQRRSRLIAKIMKRSNCTEDQAKQQLYEKAQKRNKTKTLEDLLNDHQNCDKPKHRFRTKLHLLRGDPTYQQYKAEYEVFRKYQMAIHKEQDSEVSFNSFKRFLLDSPLKAKKVPQANNGLIECYGSYHQHYYIDDKLVAVGVIDILPRCLSSVYLFYDPEYSFLNLGSYSALNELATVRSLSETLPELKFYYLGFYIDSCPKMRYKAQYQPAYLLCSETFHWIPIEECLQKLQNGIKYARFSGPDVMDENGRVNEDNVMVLQNGLIPFRRIRERLSPSNLANFRDFLRLVGRQAVREILYIFE